MQDVIGSNPVGSTNNLKQYKMRVFEYLVAYLPLEHDEDGNPPVMKPAIIDRDVVISKSEQGLVMKLTKQIPDKYDEVLEDIKIIVRPF